MILPIILVVFLVIACIYFIWESEMAWFFSKKWEKSSEFWHKNFEHQFHKAYDMRRELSKYKRPRDSKGRFR